MNLQTKNNVLSEDRGLPPSVSFGRRPMVKREPTTFSAMRAKQAERYKRGIEAASMFELPDRIVAEPVQEPE